MMNRTLVEMHKRRLEAEVNSLIIDFMVKTNVTVATVRCETEWVEHTMLGGKVEQRILASARAHIDTPFIDQETSA